LLAEQRGEEYRAKLADQRLRRELAGLREELNILIRTIKSYNLQAEAGPAIKLRERIETLIVRQDRVKDGEVDECRARLDELRGDIEKREGEMEEQFAVYVKVNAAFHKAGFRLDAGGQTPQYDQPIESTHVIKQKHNKVAVNSWVHRGGKIDFYMRGPSGKGKVLVGPDQHCNGNLEMIIARALELGLEVEEVLWKGPNGWEAMSIPGTVSSKTKPIVKQRPIYKQV
jgi:hypothetical protein